MRAGREPGRRSSLVVDRFRSSWPDLVAQVALCAALLALYGRLREWVEGSEDAARSNALEILRVEDVVGIDFERGLQERILDHGWIVETGNLIYEWMHIVSVGGFMLALWVLDRDTFRALRNALVLATIVGVVLFWAFPVAPPRAMEGFVDTVHGTVHGPGTRLPGVSNAYAAFPSFHVGWPAAAGAALVLSSPSRLVAVVAALPALAVSLAVLTTANHYVLDIVGGAVVCLGALGLVWKRGVVAVGSTARRPGVQELGGEAAG